MVFLIALSLIIFCLAVLNVGLYRIGKREEKQSWIDFAKRAMLALALMSSSLMIVALVKVFVH
ncbi:hypothetical protein HCA69_16270 [Listeria grandensis]|uniref:Uncharacterized protein n=1 Tax=Listeria grandensis TaxID=1494963 RepID=A0A7X0Y6U1_9LIST|nr:hypothetical protein [Listeria grandensis]MBC1937918.1 hypothetical protein [Listeria grandensis]